MILILKVIIWVLLSVAVIYVMCRVTNKRILETSTLLDIDDKETEKEADEKVTDEIKATPYILNFKYICLAIMIVILTGISAYVLSFRNIATIQFIKLSIAYFIVLGAGIIDLKTHTIPNYLPIALFLSRIAILIYEMIATQDAVSYLVGSLFASVFCFLLLTIAGKISKGGIGGGDIKLLTALGFMCDMMTVFSTMFVSLLVCVIVSVIFVFLKKKTFKDSVPFGPFIYVGFLAVLLIH